MKNCVIHPRFVTFERSNPANSLREKNLAFQAYFDIIQLLREDPTTFVLETGDPASVADNYNLGDSVMLWGAYREGCLETARKALEDKGIRAEFHPTGSISFLGQDSYQATA